MISKLPRWVWAGAFVLAFCAGMINVIAILGFVHKGLSHVTGNCSLWSIAVVDGDWKNIFQISLIVASFFGGAVLGGVLIGDARLRMGRRYGVALAIESALLLASTYGFVKGFIYGECFASMAAGLQNAMASTYSEAIVRTTHLTGILTDLGSLTGNWMRGLHADAKRIRLLSVIFFSFLLGGIFAVICYHRMDAYSMLIPAGIIGSSAVGYELFRRELSKRHPHSHPHHPA